MARKRPGIYDEIFNLEIGQELAVHVAAGEKVADVAARLKLRFSKWRKDERTFRLKIAGDTISIQRLAFGQGGKLADWRAMKPNTYLLLKSNPTPSDVKKARGIVDHLMTRKPGADRQLGAWLVEQSHGRLLAFCAEDVEGNALEVYMDRPNADNVKPLWAGEWP